MTKSNTPPTLGGLAEQYYHHQGVPVPGADDLSLDTARAASQLTFAADRIAVRRAVGLTMLYLAAYAARIGTDPAACMMEIIEEAAAYAQA